MHDLPHLAARLYGTPRSKLDVILGALGPGWPDRPSLLTATRIRPPKWR